MSRRVHRTIALVVVQLILCLALLWVGRMTVLADQATSARTLRVATEMRDLPANELRPGDEQAYDDVTYEEMLTFTWSPPQVMVPFLGHGPEPGSFDGEHINGDLCRTGRPVRMPKPDGVFRIFTTGGSTLWGSGAASEQRTISAYLEKMLNADAELADGRQFEVFALANPAWSSTHERIAIENRISERDPDLVISLSGLNDVHWGLVGRDVQWFRSYADQGLFDLTNAALAHLGQATMPDVAPASAPLGAEVIARRLERNVRLAAHALALEGATYLFCLQPIMPTTGKRLSPREQADLDEMPPEKVAHFRHCMPALAATLAVLEIANLRFADLTDVLDGAGPTEELFLDPYHFGDGGNRRIAARIFELIRPMLTGRN